MKDTTRNIKFLIDSIKHLFNIHSCRVNTTNSNGQMYLQGFRCYLCNKEIGLFDGLYK